jgi:hypothetical protein
MSERKVASAGERVNNRGPRLCRVQLLPRETPSPPAKLDYSLLFTAVHNAGATQNMVVPVTLGLGRLPHRKLIEYIRVPICINHRGR